MKKNTKAPTVQELIAGIFDQLDRVESLLSWSILPRQRFRIGQRIEFSRRAVRRNLIPGTRFLVRGIVRGIDGFSVRVRMDDRKQENSYHHAFLNPVSGEKLF